MDSTELGVRISSFSLWLIFQQSKRIWAAVNGIPKHNIYILGEEMY
jgi:hypothetical protein